MQSFLLHHIMLSFCKSQWILPSTSKLPRGDDGIAVGSYNHSIYLLGGAVNGYQLVQYDISEDTFIDHGDSVFSHDLYGEASYFSQIDDILYLIDYNGDTLLTYDMKTNTFDNSYRTIPSNVEKFACLASRPGYLFVIGGYSKTDNLDTVQVLNIATNGWLDSVPSMQEARVGHACTVDPNTNILYAIGGYTWNKGAATYIASIEKIDTNNIEQHAWSYVSGSLLIAAGYLRSVIHNNLIYVIGGAYGALEDWTCLDTVHIIDVTANTIYISSERLVYRASNTASIIVDNIIYVFGGYNGISVLDTWMMYELIDIYTYEPTSQTIPTVVADPVTSTKEAIVTSHATTTSELTTTAKPTVVLTSLSESMTSETMKTETMTTETMTTGTMTTTETMTAGTMTKETMTTETIIVPTLSEAMTTGTDIIAMESTGSGLEIQSTNNVQLIGDHKDKQKNNLLNVLGVHWIAVISVAICMLFVVGIISFIRAVKRGEKDVAMDNEKQLEGEQATTVSNNDRIQTDGDDLGYGGEQKIDNNQKNNDEEGEYSASSSQDHDSMYNTQHDGVTSGGNEDEQTQYIETTGGDVGLCVDCKEIKMGQICETNALFYCTECWEYYGDDGEDDTNSMYAPLHGELNATESGTHYGIPIDSLPTLPASNGAMNT